MKNINDSYYKLAHAQALKPCLDAMLVDRKQRSFNAKEHNKSINSLFIQLNRAWLYLTDHLDPDGKYARLREEVFISKNVVSGEVTLSFDKKRRVNGIPESVAETQPHFVGSVTITPDTEWREPLEDWLENETQGELSIENILLTEEGLAYVQGQVAMMQGMVEVIKLDQTQIKLRKI